VNDEEILKALTEIVRAQRENNIASCREHAERDEAAGNEWGARHWREQLAVVEALPKPWEDLQAA
jgi:hypothetical protein